MADSRIIKIMTQDSDGSELVTYAEQTAETLVRNNLRNTQIRNIFTEVRKIEALRMQDPQAALRRLQMLKPKMAYQAARQRSVQHLQHVLSEAIDQVISQKESDKQAEAFQRFMDLFEAILAYHKAKGGRN
jgi:CRISPR-associated protein Csm2